MRVDSTAVRSNFCFAYIAKLLWCERGPTRIWWLLPLLACSGCVEAYIPGNQLPPAPISIPSPSVRPGLALVVNELTYHSGITVPFADFVHQVTESSGFTSDFSVSTRSQLGTEEFRSDFEIRMFLYFGEERDELWSLLPFIASLFIFPSVMTTPVYLDAVVRDSAGRVIGSYALQDSYRHLLGFSILPSFLWLRRGIDVGEGIIKNLVLSLYQEIECHGVLRTDRSHSRTIPGCPKTSHIEASEGEGVIDPTSGAVQIEVGDTMYIRANQVGLWSEPITSSEKILLERGHSVKIIDKQAQWCRVEDGSGAEGWVVCAFLSPGDPL